ncbi:N-formylglutamate amidohydrolase [Litorimonas cladophorae]|uniref:N-formylglutamate amidohydrolase n=1 Tax=Litorimonas cladophorae TaxID=1220491 RepID=A0A918NIW4_9PROT|nr:N-formylglutamate amidohydrolase [Litorimonas cladophorae]GGX73413.1 N-formylglutamate amidohydrolase [Litorimonas cladophorae]
MSEPFHIIPSTSDVPLFLFGDHASRHIPERYGDLGLTGEDLTRHIAWDIGTEALIRGLCARFGCGGIVAGFSRLLIDPNRSKRMDSLIPKDSDGTVIPGNQDVDAEVRQERIDTLYAPYHQALSKQLSAQNSPLTISVHSFTPKPHMGERRRLDMGLLVKHDKASAERFKLLLNQLAREYSVGINEPYSAMDLNHTVDLHIAPRALPHLAIEIRQDHIDTEAGVARFVKLIGDALKSML